MINLFFLIPLLSLVTSQEPLTFEYTGSVQEFEVPYDGLYKL